LEVKKEKGEEIKIKLINHLSKTLIFGIIFIFYRKIGNKVIGMKQKVEYV